MDPNDPTQPVFYIDEEIQINDADGIKLAKGVYDLTVKDGVIKDEIGQYSFTGYIDAPYSK